MPALDLDGGLGGLHHRDDLSARHGIAGLDEPLVERALVHVGAEGRHHEVDHHARTEEAVDRGDDLLRLRQGGLFEVFGVRNRHLGATDPRDRGVEVEERLFDDARADLGRQTAGAPRLVDDHGTVGLAHRFDDRVVVQRAKDT